MSFVSELFKNCMNSSSGQNSCSMQSWIPVAAAAAAAVAIPIIRYTNIIPYIRNLYNIGAERIPCQFSSSNTQLVSQSNLPPLLNPVIEFPEYTFNEIAKNTCLQNPGVNCALCCVLYGLFATTNIFDPIFLEDPNNMDNEVNRIIRNKLIEIVNLMRKKHLVQGPDIELLRGFLEIYGLPDGYTDPQFVINAIVKALNIPKDRIVTLEPSQEGHFEDVINSLIVKRCSMTDDPLTSQDTKVLIFQTQNEEEQYKYYIPKTFIEIEDKKYKLTAINVHVHKNHYITYSLRSQQFFKFDPHPGESLVEFCPGLYGIVNDNSNVPKQKIAKALFLLSLDYKSIQEQLQHITHGAQYIYVRI